MIILDQEHCDGCAFCAFLKSSWSGKRVEDEIQPALHLSSQPQLLRPSSTPSAERKGCHFYKFTCLASGSVPEDSFCPWEPLLTSHRVTERATSSSDGKRMNWVPSTFIFPKREERSKSLFNSIPDSSEHGSRFSPGSIRNTHSPTLLAQKPNTLSSLCFGLNSSHCLNYFQVVKWGIWSGLSGA